MISPAQLPIPWECRDKKYCIFYSRSPAISETSLIKIGTVVFE